jgi:lipopolysaccharide/colanic/teichoic acid biosynthesis glycosyltransferase
MSFVGPRALPINERQQREGETQFEDDQVAFFSWRTLARPGLTGIAQIFAPRDVSRRNKFRYDKFYVLRQSLALEGFRHHIVYRGAAITS